MGCNGIGTASEMKIIDRMTLALDGLIICAIDVIRAVNEDEIYQNFGLKGIVRITTRGLRTNKELLLKETFKVTKFTLQQLRCNANLYRIEREIGVAVKLVTKTICGRSPEIIVIAHERDQRLA